MNKTYQPKKGEVKRTWHLIDAKGKILGRLSSKVAMLLMGKHKVDYSAHMDSGDFVVIINAKEVKVTGNKEQDKKYYRHSGYPGGFRETNLASLRKNHPERIIETAVKRMLPENRLRDKRMRRMFVIAGDQNPYAARFTDNA